MDAKRRLGANPDTVLRREGFRLLSTRHAAIPVWSVKLNCRVLKTSRVDTFTEFVLRAIDLGVDTAEDVTRLLNLPSEVVDGVLGELLLNRHVMVNSATSEGTFTLSATGRTLVSTLVDERVVPSAVTYLIDGLSGEPLWVPKELILNPTEIDDEPRLILEADNDIDLEFGPLDSDRFINVEPVRPDRNATLLTVLNVESTAKQYIDAAVLLFESEQDPSDRYLRVCVDGRADERVEAQVRELGMLQSMRVESRIDEDRRRVDRFIPQDVLATRALDTEVENILGELWKLQTISASDEEETAVDARRNKLRARLSGFSVRHLSLSEVADSTEVRMLQAREGVYISASRLWPRNRRAHYIDLLRQVLAGGCPVTLETSSVEDLTRADQAEVATLTQDFRDAALTFATTKPAHEASFIVFDGTAMTVYAGTPFIELVTTANRLGDDRPTIIQGSGRLAAIPQSQRATGPVRKSDMSSTFRR